MKKLIIVASVIATIALFNMQGSKANDIVLMASTVSTQSSNCNYAGEGWYCYAGQYCRHGGEVGAYCKDQEESEIQ